MAKKKQTAVPDWPATRGVEMVPLDKITAHPQNPRTHPDSQLDGIGAAFDEFGVVVPPIVDENFRLLAGEGRWRAAQKKKLAELPCIVVRGWSEAKKKRFLVADNRLPMLAGFDDNLYRAILSQISNDGLLAAIGFDDASLAEALANPNGDVNDPDAEVPEPPKKPVVRKGDLWILGEHRILCGDSTSKSDVAVCLGEARPNLMVTDPPYGVSYDPGWRADRGIASRIKYTGTSAAGRLMNDETINWTKAWNLYEGSVAYVWEGDRQVTEHGGSLSDSGFEIRNLIVWAKPRLVISRGHYHPKHELCCYAVRVGGTANWNGGRKQTTVWDDIPAHFKSETGHSTQKPIECMKRPIENNSRSGEHIYEPFCGSGTTLIACEMTGRKCLAIELDPAYVQVAIERWQKATGKLATLDGRTLEQVANARRKGRAKGATDAAGNSGKPVARKKSRGDGRKQTVRPALHVGQPPEGGVAVGEPPIVAGNT